MKFPSSFLAIFLLFSLSHSGFAQSSVTFNINSEGTNIAVNNAEIAVMQSDIKTLSDSTGMAVLEGLEDGFYLLSIKHPNYIGQTLTLNLASSQNVEKNVVLIPSLDEVVVTAERFDNALRDRGFYDRKNKGSATFLTPEDIQKKGKLNPIDIFRNIPGVNIIKEAYGDLHVVSSRRPHRGKILVSSKPCIMDVYLDGAVATGSIENVVNSVDEVVGAEIYKGPSTLPPKYNRNNPCGAILIWTKSGLAE